MQKTLQANQLEAQVSAVLAGAGSLPDEADKVAANLVLANLSGHDSHGVGMLPRYVDAVLEGGLKPNTGVRVLLDTGSLLTLDAQRGYGQVRTLSMTQAPRQDLFFSSHGLRCAAWFYPALGVTPSALVIMAHGLGATRELGLDAYALRFQAAGLGVLVFDYRHYGGSKGEPRELMSVGKQLDDWRAAIAFGKTLPNIDPNRVAIWGSSFGGGLVMRLAIEELGVAAAVSQVPFSNGLASTLKIPTVTALLITLNALLDLVRQLLGLSPRYIGLVGRPGEVAMMTAADCKEGYMKLVSPELLASGAWRNRMCARAGLAVPMYMRNQVGRPSHSWQRAPPGRGHVPRRAPSFVAPAAAEHAILYPGAAYRL